MRTISSLRFAVLLAAATMACDDDRRPVTNEIPTGPGVIAPTALSAYMTVSDPRPAVGQRLTITVRALRGQAVGKIGSFTLKLAYDSTRLRLIDTERSEFGMVMANGTTRGIVRAAGASSQGFTDDRLLTATFLVIGARPTGTLKLDVSELNSVAFEDQRPAMQVDQTVYRAETK